MSRTPIPGDDALVGSWTVDVQVKGGPSFVNISSFMPGGVAINTSGRGHTWHGAWARTGEGEYGVTFVSIDWDGEGGASGRGTIRTTLTLGADGDTFAGPYVVEATDAAGTVEEAYRGEVRAARIAVEPMGAGTPAS